MNTIRYMIFLGVLVAGVAFPGPAPGATAIDPAAPPPQPPAPLLNNLGDLHHPITTRSAQAQRYFDQGLILLYGFNHAEAIRSFQGAAHEDPECAMAWWGVAYAYGPNINAPMASHAVPKAWEALQKAQALQTKASRAEQDYVDALAKRYRRDAGEDRSALDHAYMESMRELSRSYPDDLDAAVLFAESIMDTMPWNYWTSELNPKPATRELLGILEAVLRREPDHPGANHLYIHTVESGPHPEMGIPSADRLGGFAPGAGHLVHMPSHIYVRVGDYEKASDANVDAIRADETYISHCRAQGFYPGLYYPHAVHFLWFTRGLEGRSRECIGTAKKVAQYALDGRCGVLEGPRLRHLPLLAEARFGRWDAILSAPELSSSPFDQAMWHYARGLAYAGRKQPDEAAAEHAAFQALANSDEVKAMDNPYLPATGILKVADRVLAARVARAAGRLEEAIAHYRQAAAAEDALPYMEPPYWYYPVRQSLGAALLEVGRPAEAEMIFREDFKAFPRNGWSLHGLALSLERQGKTIAAENVEREFRAAWRNADVALDLEWY